MVYIGDGFTDVPCMKLVREKGGHSIAVYQQNRSYVDDLVINGRADLGITADYSEGSDMERAVFAILDEAAAVNKTIGMHLISLEAARDSKEGVPGME